METYEQLLNEAYKKVKQVENKERFEIPEVQGMIEGTKTIITNFSQIASHIRREADHLEKFLEKSLAAQGKRDGDRLILIKKVPASKINEKIQDYVKIYVICKECGKPDTEIQKKDSFLFKHCLACGAKHSLAKI